MLTDIEGAVMDDLQNSAKQRIRSAAWRQFRGAGYIATTYASIAKECGVGRSLVQYHFPKKEELPISLVSWVLEKAAEALEADVAGTAGDHVAFHRIGTCTFTFLLEKGFSRFMLEMLESRTIAEALLSMNVDWTIEHMADGRPESHDVTQTVIMDMGGFYDYMYHCLANDEGFDVAGCLATSVHSSAQALSPDKGYVLGDFELDDDDKGKISHAVEKVASLFERSVSEES